MHLPNKSPMTSEGGHSNSEVSWSDDFVSKSGMSDVRCSSMVQYLLTV